MQAKSAAPTSLEFRRTERPASRFEQEPADDRVRDRDFVNVATLQLAKKDDSSIDFSGQARR